uniref:Uncharacterized protein n=1 Tax=Sorghum bicolor TaxID=4558 RepID=Q9XE89_SORBI|nr:hypothetical protein [Sorghum bicolor]
MAGSNILQAAHISNLGSKQCMDTNLSGHELWVKTTNFDCREWIGMRPCLDARCVRLRTTAIDQCNGEACRRADQAKVRSAFLAVNGLTVLPLRSPRRRVDLTCSPASIRSALPTGSRGQRRNCTCRKACRAPVSQRLVQARLQYTNVPNAVVLTPLQIAGARRAPPPAKKASISASVGGGGGGGGGDGVWRRRGPCSGSRSRVSPSLSPRPRRSRRRSSGASLSCRRAPSPRPSTRPAALPRRGLPHARCCTCLSAASAAPHHRRRADPARWRRGLPLVLGGPHAAATGGTRRPLRSVRHDDAASASAAAAGAGLLLLPRILTHLPIDRSIGGAAVSLKKLCGGSRGQWLGAGGFCTGGWLALRYTVKL